MLDVPLSVLDVVPVTGDEPAEAALERAAALARLADELGYVRLWYAEHHNMPGIASSAPEVLTARAASITGRIRVGSGGVMLPNHAPLVVAERLATLEGYSRAGSTSASAARRAPTSALPRRFAAARAVRIWTPSWPNCSGTCTASRPAIRSKG